MSLLEVTDLVSGYGDSTILHGVSLEIQEREVASLLGPNGSGKSTLVKSILKTHDVTIHSGSVRFKDEDVTRESYVSLIRKGLSYIPQSHSVFPGLTVRENLELGGYTVSDGAKVKQKIEEIFDLFPVLEERKRAKASTLSGGERRMLEIGRGLIPDPELLFLDEPSAGLAPQITEDVFKLIEQINDQEDIGVLIVEQNPKYALDISDRGFILDQGELVIADTPSNILAESDLSSVYLGGLEA